MLPLALAPLHAVIEQASHLVRVSGGPEAPDSRLSDCVDQVKSGNYTISDCGVETVAGLKNVWAKSCEARRLV